MASSKNKLTEEQLSEGIFTRILNQIIQGRVKKVGKALENAPNIKAASEELDGAVLNLRKSIKDAKRKGQI